MPTTKHLYQQKTFRKDRLRPGRRDFVCQDSFLQNSFARSRLEVGLQPTCLPLTANCNVGYHPKRPVHLCRLHHPCIVLQKSFMQTVGRSHIKKPRTTTPEKVDKPRGHFINRRHLERHSVPVGKDKTCGRPARRSPPSFGGRSLAERERFELSVPSTGRGLDPASQDRIGRGQPPTAV